ncbi:hypothetical protein ABK040_014250 [Willaertia magna]
MRRKQQDGLLLDFGENHSPTTPTLNSPISNFEEDNEEKEEFIEHHSKKKSTKKSSKKKPSHLTTTPKHVRTTSTGSSNSNNSSTSTSMGTIGKKASHLRTNSTSSSTSNNSPVFFPTSKLQQGYQSSSLYSDNNNNNDSYQQQDGYQASSSFGSSNNKSNIRILSKTNTMGNNKYQGFGSKDVYPQVISSDNSYNNNNKAYNNGMNNEGNNSPILSRERGKFEGISSSSFNSYNSNNNSYQSEEQQPGHIGSMKNNYYQQARQQMKEENESFSFLKVIADMLKYIYTTIVPSTKSGGNNTNGAFDASVQFPQPQIYLNDEMRNHLEQFKEFCKIPFQIENVKHQKLLFQLYKICTKKQTSEIHGEHWKYLGFQNTKPESDFRGAGLLGITNLIYFGKNYKKRFLRYFQKVSNGMELNEDGTFSSYPFVIAGLNVTMMLFDILGWGQNATKSHNIKARKKFIELLTSEGGKAVVNEGDDEGEDIAEDNVESEGNTPNTASSGRTKEGTLLDFDDFLSSPNSTQKIVDSSIGNNSNNGRRKKKNGKDEESPMSWSNNDKDWENNGEDSPVPTTKKTTSKRKKKTTTNHSFNLDFFNELYVVGFICLHKEWYKTKATYFEFGRVLANSRKHVEDLLELQFHSFDDVKHFNSIAK